ncbi:Y+L amino acid transporter 2-like [Penaeus chinensis]|uniref:Y+L amino acid transporter 2-like n=1 Tax=Penaeus chinensis TaxID=139456 RepID=UPI001FB5F730|nr:Y+L amino acid transporter 2-like [Penaeus chinensis]
MTPTRNRVHPTAPADHEPLLDTCEDEIESRSVEVSNESLKLRKELGLIDGVGIIVGIIIGSGIFVSPQGVIRFSGSVGMSLVVWGVSGVLSMVGALCYAELGTMIPKSGGDYAYIHEAFGSLPAFLFMWMALLIILPTSNTVMALTFAKYIIKPAFLMCDGIPDVPVRLIAAVIVCFLTWVNCTNVKWATKVQGVFTAAKIMALLIIIVAGIYQLCNGHVENYQDAFEDTNWSITSVCTAFYQGLFSFAGWNCLNFVVEELKDPFKTLPRAILISMPIVTLIYFLTNMAYFVVLEPDEVLASEAVALSFAGRALGVLNWVMPIFVALSTFGSLNGCIFACSRLFFVGAREGHLPQALALINVHTITPVPALVFLGFMTLCMLVTSDTLVLINYVSFTESLFVFLSIAALLWMRYKDPHRHRPIKIWIGIPIVFFFICLFLVVFPIVERPVELGIASGIFFAGVPVYYLCVHKASKSKKFCAFMGKFTSVIQLLYHGLPEEDD